MGADMNACAFHRIFGTMHDIDVQYGEIMMGKAPSNPFLWSAGGPNWIPAVRRQASTR